MKNLLAMAAGMVLLLVNNISIAQSGHMTNGDSWRGGWMGGYGGAWMPVLLIVALVALVVWIVKQKNK